MENSVVHAERAAGLLMGTLRVQWMTEQKGVYFSGLWSVRNFRDE